MPDAPHSKYYFSDDELEKVLYKLSNVLDILIAVDVKESD